MTKIMPKRFSLCLLGGTLIAVLLFLMSIQLCLPAYAAEPEAECWAVIIGVSNYQSIEDLNYADDGAKELFQLLSPAWGEEHIKLLLDSEATKAEVRRAVEWLASNEEANDSVLFYFSGHGDPEGYLAPYNAYYEETWISSGELGSWLRPLDSERVVVILDTCHAGQFESNLSDSGRVVLMSSRSDEYSWETSHLKNGVFTYYLLEALSEFAISDANLDFEISAEEIFQYAEPETTLETIDFEEIQHPVLSDQYSGELSLLLKLILNVEPEMPSGFNILILDNEEYSSLPVELTLAAGSAHNLTIISPINTAIGTRYVFSSWDDGNTSASRTISHGGVYTANCKKQCELVIESAYGQPEGEGWYQSGSTATISVAPSVGFGIRHIFTGWSGDYSGTSATASLTMNSPKTITANWRTDFTQLYIIIGVAVVIVGVILTVVIRRRMGY